MSTRAYIFALLAGCMLPAAFAPFNYWVLAILSPLALLALWQSVQTPKQAFGIGLCFGVGLFGVGVSWVFVSIHTYGGTHILLAAFITTLLIVVLALFIALQGYMLKRFFRGSSIACQLLGFPASWVLFEWLRSCIFTGFPWLYLGYAGLNTPLQGYGPVFSVYGISTAFVLCSGALYTAWRTIGNAQMAAILILALTGFCGAALNKKTFVRAVDKIYTVSLIQGNIKPFDKFTHNDPIGSTEKTYGTLTKPLWGRDLILWPEGAIPLALPSANFYVEHLKKLTIQHDTTLITGAQFINPQGDYYNSLIAINKNNPNALYHKVHLLPFGDFLPFEKTLRGLIGFFDLPMSSFKAGPSMQPLIHAGKTGALLLNPLICYEIAFPEQVRQTLRNAQAIVTISEDGWFGASLGPHQHLQIAQMRALETGRYVLRATTSGRTAIINEKGQIVSEVPPFTKTVLNGTFYAMEGQTPWVRWGVWPLLSLLIFAFVLPYKKSVK